MAKKTWLLCDSCIAAIKSRGEKIYVGDMISQDIDYDEKKETWFQIYDENEPIKKCDWCEEPNPELYECI